jgi:glycosyltransferase involved in cell wall biosynthesis
MVPLSRNLGDRSEVGVKIVWFVSSLERRGGGERFVLESGKALRYLGHDVHMVCDRMSSDASFDGVYDLSDVVCTRRAYVEGKGYLWQAFDKLLGVFALYGKLVRLKPDVVICQSEYDCIRIYLISLLLKFKHRVFVFGQMYQFSTDLTRYSNVFRRHLETIVFSRPGYIETVQMPPPKLPFVTRLTNELVSRMKYRAIRSADQVFTLSQQVRWEVSLLYGRDALVCRAAFNESYIDEVAVSQPRDVGSPFRLLSICRLIDKKRVDLTIRAFSSSKLPGTLVIIGAGSEEARLKELAAVGPRSSDILFLGLVEDSILLREIALADCFISMDVGDYDISVVEAMGKGVRVLVASDFDLTPFGDSFKGVVSVAPEVHALSTAIDAIPVMSSPSRENLPVLRELTWQALASKCVA